jgi:hypothetical protein
MSVTPAASQIRVPPGQRNHRHPAQGVQHEMKLPSVNLVSQKHARNTNLDLNRAARDFATALARRASGSPRQLRWRFANTHRHQWGSGAGQRPPRLIRKRSPEAVLTTAW